MNGDLLAKPREGSSPYSSVVGGIKHKPKINLTPLSYREKRPVNLLGPRAKHAMKFDGIGHSERLRRINNGLLK
ncbi:MAG: hypothetical protein HYY48_08195 [Gammaproteobacteria bacterium]|nr:hypothetical protein [Gammaproteobacteria bacterium]